MARGLRRLRRFVEEKAIKNRGCDSSTRIS